MKAKPISLTKVVREAGLEVMLTVWRETPKYYRPLLILRSEYAVRDLELWSKPCHDPLREPFQHTELS